MTDNPAIRFSNSSSIGLSRVASIGIAIPVGIRMSVSVIIRICCRSIDVVILFKYLESIVPTAMIIRHWFQVHGRLVFKLLLA